MIASIRWFAGANGFTTLDCYFGWMDCNFERMLRLFLIDKRCNFNGLTNSNPRISKYAKKNENVFNLKIKTNLPGQLKLSSVIKWAIFKTVQVGLFVTNTTIVNQKNIIRKKIKRVK